MKKLTVIFAMTTVVLLASVSSCQKDDECKNNLFISSITPTFAFTGQKNGTVSITVTGDTAGVTYSLNKGPFQSSPDFDGLEPGKYAAEVKNDKKCSNSLDFDIPASDPCTTIPILVTATKTDPFTGINNGTITATASGGANFTYSLNGQSAVSSGVFSGLAAGNYTITAKNGYGCANTTSVSLAGINACSVINVDASYTKVDPTSSAVSNGSITAIGVNSPSNQGGTPFTFSLDRVNNGAYTSSALFSNLSVGTYKLTVRNSFGCTDAVQINLVANVNCASRVITVTGTSSPEIPCTSQGSITASASGPITPFTYSLSQNGSVIRSYSSSPTFANLSAGSYVITARDADGCVKVSSTIVVATASAGPNYLAVKNILKSSKCSNASCHPKYGDFLTNDCTPITYGSRIYARTITETVPARKMPPANNLTTAEMNSIKAWFAGGFKYNN